MAKRWKASDSTKAKWVGEIEFQDEQGEWHLFEVLRLPDRLLFGGSCNACWLESGYIKRESFETLEETLSELLQDLETYYRDGKRYTSRIICNARM